MFTLVRPERFAQEIRRSRFVAKAGPVGDEADARRFVAEQGEPGAGHNCWAWRIGNRYRFSDDGEPGGTAGKPILQAIEGLMLDRVAVVVSRWFGGVLLGSGGLMRAYGGTASSCLRTAERRELVPFKRMALGCGFCDLALVQARLAGWADVAIDDQRFTDTGAVLNVRLPETDAEPILTALTDLTSGRIAIASMPDEPA